MHCAQNVCVCVCVYLWFSDGHEVGDRWAPGCVAVTRLCLRLQDKILAGALGPGLGERQSDHIFLILVVSGLSQPTHVQRRSSV